MPSWGGGANKGDASTNKAEEVTEAASATNTTDEDTSAAESEAEPTSPASE